MKVLNFGSLNLDYVYEVDHILRPGETISSKNLEMICGGKGLNQSAAMARAGLPVYHAGMVGEEGQPLLDLCDEFGIDRTYIRRIGGRSGHTMIQVDKEGQNSILLFGGANRQVTETYVDEVLKEFGAGDYLVLQNEISSLSYMIERAYDRGMCIVLNPSPYDERLLSCNLDKVSYLFINEIEGEQMTGESAPEKICEVLLKRYPRIHVVLTLGAQGSLYASGSEEAVYCDSFAVKAVDTTAAGDTFSGYFLYSVVNHMPVPAGLRLASAAAAIAVTRKGAAPSIPALSEVESFLCENG